MPDGSVHEPGHSDDGADVHRLAIAAGPHGLEHRLQVLSRHLGGVYTSSFDLEIALRGEEQAGRPRTSAPDPVV
jgi:hypothetical protein